MAAIFFAGLAVLILVAYLWGAMRGRSLARAGQVHSRPGYHGAFLVVCVLVPAILAFVIGAPVGSHHAESQALAGYPAEVLSDGLRRGATLRDITSVANGQYAGTPSAELRQSAERYSSAVRLANIAILVTGFGLGLLSLLVGRQMLSQSFRARNNVERFVTTVLFICAAVAVLTTVGIVLSVLFESLRFFSKISILDFLFGTQWSPQIAMRADQGGGEGAFGIVPLITGTLLITLIAILVAGPIGLFAAIYLAEYASPRFRAIVKPILEILAGIPTVVLGFFAALTVAPLIRGWGEQVGLDVASESALAAGLVMGMMIIPFISSLSDDVINAVPQALRDGSLSMGATKSETIQRVVLPAALPGIVSAFMLAISRAVGETMIVVMAAGLAANLTFNPLAAVTTFTVQIKTILVGDQEFDSAKTLAAFALGLFLFFFTLMLNVIAQHIVRRYREQYD